MKVFVLYTGDFQEGYVKSIDALENAKVRGYFNNRIDAFVNARLVTDASSVILLQEFILQNGELTLTDAGSGINIMSKAEFYNEGSGGMNLMDWADITNKPLEFPSSSHGHALNEISDFNSNHNANENSHADIRALVSGKADKFDDEVVCDLRGVPTGVVLPRLEIASKSSMTVPISHNGTAEYLCYIRDADTNALLGRLRHFYNGTHNWIVLMNYRDSTPKDKVLHSYNGVVDEWHNYSCVFDNVIIDNPDTGLLDMLDGHLLFKYPAKKNLQDVNAKLKSHVNDEAVHGGGLQPVVYGSVGITSYIEGNGAVLPTLARVGNVVFFSWAGKRGGGTAAVPTAGADVFTIPVGFRPMADVAMIMWNGTATSNSLKIAKASGDSASSGFTTSTISQLSVISASACWITADPMPS